MPSLKKEQAAELLWLGAVYLDGERISVDQAVHEGQILRLHLQARRFQLPLGKPAEFIVAENKDFLIANKPVGLPTHATVDNQQENFLKFLSASYGPLSAAQRLDNQTSGLLTFARSPKAHFQFQKWLQQGLVKKRYLAITKFAPPLGCHKHWMDTSGRPPHKIFSSPTVGAKECELEIKVTVPFLRQTMSEKGNCYQVEIKLITGRTHQIRAQLVALGTPLIGDHLYGKGQHQSDEFCLRCVSIETPVLSGHCT